MKADRIAALVARFPTEFPPNTATFGGSGRRFIEAVIDRHRAGESVEDIILDLPHEKPELIRAILEEEDANRSRK